MKSEKYQKNITLKKITGQSCRFKFGMIEAMSDGESGYAIR